MMIIAVKIVSTPPAHAVEKEKKMSGTPAHFIQSEL